MELILRRKHNDVGGGVHQLLHHDYHVLGYFSLSQNIYEQ